MFNSPFTPLPICGTLNKVEGKVTQFTDVAAFITKSKLVFYVLFNSQGHIVTGPRYCHLWELNPYRIWMPMIRWQIC